MGDRAAQVWISRRIRKAFLTGLMPFGRSSGHAVLFIFTCTIREAHESRSYVIWEGVRQGYTFLSVRQHANQGLREAYHYCMASDYPLELLS